VNWYSIYTYSGYEKRVKRDIEHRASIEGLREKLGQVLIPEERIVEIKDGKRKESTRNFMPGYVFIQMVPDNDLFKMVRDINGVSQFVGTGDVPSVLSEEEVKNVLGLIEDKQDKPKAEIKFRQGDQVKVIEGPFANFIGTVEQIDFDRSRLKVMVSIFGRSTPVDLAVLEVEKAD
jgi:transcription termination/antitermination protein NusG